MKNKIIFISITTVGFIFGTICGFLVFKYVKVPLPYINEIVEIPNPTRGMSSTTTPIKDESIPEPEIIMDLSEEAISNWNLYEDDEFRFNIKYPCNKECRESSLAPYRTQYSLKRKSIYIIKGQLGIGINVFTKDSIEEFNNYLRNVDPDHEIGDPEPFRFSLDEIKEFLSLPVGSEIKLPIHNSFTKIKVGETPAQIVMINEYKAIMFNKMSRFSSGREYIINRGEGVWIDIDESYLEGDVFKNEILDENTKNKMIIYDKILNTFTFY